MQENRAFVGPDLVCVCADPLQPRSPGEREVLRLIVRGYSNRQIARDLAIGEQTVKTHVRSILTKLGLQDRVQAAIFALRHQTDSCEQP